MQSGLAKAAFYAHVPHQANAIHYSRIAVGTAVAGGPPHKSVREELPHTAPPLGITVKITSSLPAVAARVHTSHVRHSVRYEYIASAFPLGDPLSSADSATGVPVLFARFAGTMGPSDFLSAFMSALPSETFSDRSTSAAIMPRRPKWKPTGSPGSRAWDVCACTGSTTPPRSPTPHQ